MSNRYPYPTDEKKHYGGRDFTPFSTPLDRVAQIKCTKIEEIPLASRNRDSKMTTSDLSHDLDHHSDPTHSHDPDSNHAHVHSEESIRRVVNRLSRIEGHIRGIKSMVQSDRACPDVLVQIAAVRGALDRVARMILDEHLTQCVARAAKEGNIEAEIEELKAALDRFLI